MREGGFSQYHHYTNVWLSVTTTSKFSDWQKEWTEHDSSSVGSG
jgi:hypothetical protein